MGTLLWQSCLDLRLVISGLICFIGCVIISIFYLDCATFGLWATVLYDVVTHQGDEWSFELIKLPKLGMEIEV